MFLDTGRFTSSLFKTGIYVAIWAIFMMVAGIHGIYPCIMLCLLTLAVFVSSLITYKSRVQAERERQMEKDRIANSQYRAAMAHYRKDKDDAQSQ